MYLENTLKVAEQLPNKGPNWNFHYTRIRNISPSHPTSKYPSRHVVSARGKLKLTEKNLHIRNLYYLFQYSSVLVISRCKWLIQAEA